MNNQWVRAKSFDTFCPLGPAIVLASPDIDPQNLNLKTVLNGEVVQSSNTRDMIFSVAEIISFISQATTLLPGSVILTGTPQGVGFTRSPPVYLHPEDVIECSIEGIGTLRNSVIAES